MIELKSAAADPRNLRLKCTVSNKDWLNDQITLVTRGYKEQSNGGGEEKNRI